jgi:hypothetical protein
MRIRTPERIDQRECRAWLACAGGQGTAQVNLMRTSAIATEQSIAK